jgi:hypothetical protein
MSLIVPRFDDSVVVRSGEAEGIGRAPTTVVIAPGVERFEYFGHLERIAYGEVPPESLLEVEEVYDTYFMNSPAWESARATT